LFDQATWIAFNMPVGTVMTLMDNVHPVQPGKSVADLSGCGRSVDLVGTGRTEAADVSQVNMNDCISSFFWREVDLNLGAFEVFEDTNFKGNRSTIFLSEWEPGAIFSIGNWYLQDRISSVRWKALSDRQTAALFDNSNGTGDLFDNIKGWGDTKEIADLAAIRFNDRASAFRWDGIVPKKEIVAPFNVTASSDGPGSFGLSSVVSGVNRTSAPQPVTVTLNNTDAQTVTVATTDQYATTVSSTFTGHVLTAATWSVTATFSYTHSDTKTKTETKTIMLSVQQTVNAPPNSNYKATLLVSIAKLPPTLFHTTAERWYDEPLSGSHPDPLNNNWFKRVEPVTLSVEGSLASSTTVNIEATPIIS
jgi:hypothetical protein